METPLEKKRRGYLSFFCDGVIDSVAHRELDIKKKSSAYYKQGYDFGVDMYCQSRLDMQEDEKNGEL